MPSKRAHTSADPNFVSLRLKQSKSRNGCVSCKKSRIKCDEAKPVCTQCTTRRVKCGGYQRDLIWRSFRESTNRSLRTTTAQSHRLTAAAISTSTRGTSHATKLQEMVTWPSIHIEPRVFAPSTPTSSRSRSQSFSEDHDCEIYDPVRDGSTNGFTACTLDAHLQLELFMSAKSLDPEEPILDIPVSLPLYPTEALTVRFHRETASILSIKDGLYDNPWRTLMWQMAASSDALRHALLAMAALHGSSCDPQLRTIGVLHTTESIRKLIIEMHNLTWELTLATALALALGETWYHRTSTGMNHLRGIRKVVLEALAKRQVRLQLGLFTPTDATRIKFLVNTYVYLYAIACLTSTEDYDIVDLESLISAVNQPLHHGGHEIDPLMGCATTLFPLLGKVASITQKVRKSRVVSLSVVSEANDLKEKLLRWTAPAVCTHEQSEDFSVATQHALLTAEAYRRAILLHLELAVTELLSDSPEQQAVAILTILAATPLSSQTMIIQIFPLLIGSCEVDSTEDRQWVTQRWQAMIDRLAIVNVASCWEVVKEVWKRRDACQEPRQTETPPSICRSTSYTHVIPRTDASETQCRRMYRRSLTQDSMLRLGRTQVQRFMLDGRQEYSVRGRLHWLSVMSDWGWEVFL